MVIHEEKHKEDKTSDDGNLKMKTKIKPSENLDVEEKRHDNPYNIKINLLPTKVEQEKYNDVNFKFQENLVPNPENRYCEKHGNEWCSRQSAIERYLIISDKVHIHDIFPVDDSRNKVCRVYFLDTTSPGSVVKSNKWNSRGTYNVVSYRMMFDFFLLEMTDGCSATGYIAANNRRRRMLCGSSAKECPKKVWIQAVGDFENALRGYP